MLKPTFEALQATDSQSFLVRNFQQEAFRAPYHFHPELELTLILRGQGKRYVGNRMDAFEAGDLVLLGSNLPHCWKTESGDTTPDSAAAIVIQFPPGFLGEDFLTRPELSGIRQLLQRAENGLRFTGQTRDIAAGQIQALLTERGGFEKMIALLEMLEMLSRSAAFEILAPQPMTANIHREDQQRMGEVFAYVVDHFRGGVSLAEAARVAGLSPNAFCKYFKRITRKTFMETVIGYRLNYAAQQLVQTDQPVSAVCFDSGFGDISHFNKTFKAKMHLSPLHYRKKFVRDIQSLAREER